MQVIAERDIGRPDLRQARARIPCERTHSRLQDGDRAVGVDVRRSYADGTGQGGDPGVGARGRSAPGVARLRADGATQGEPRADVIAAHDLALPVGRVGARLGKAGRKPQILHAAVLVQEGMPRAGLGLRAPNRNVPFRSRGRNRLLAAKRAQILEPRPMPQEGALSALRVLVPADELARAIHCVCLAVRAKQGCRTGGGVPPKRMMHAVARVILNDARYLSRPIYAGRRRAAVVKDRARIHPQPVTGLVQKRARQRIAVVICIPDTSPVRGQVESPYLSRPPDPRRRLVVGGRIRPRSPHRDRQQADGERREETAEPSPTCGHLTTQSSRPIRYLPSTVRASIP